MRLNKNELIYIQVCQLHFKQNATETEIVKILGYDNLKNYEHLNIDGTIKFNHPLDAVIKIISCERRAHIQASQYEDII